MQAFRILVCFLLLVTAAFGRESVTTKSTQPEVFLITIDTLRADHVHCYGYEKLETPTLDALAHDGIRFTQAFTPSPITNTSHASILTGLLPSSHGVTDFAVPLSTAHPTVAELLKAQGYRTGALIVVVGDHGEGLGEHHEDTHGIFLYDSTTHVPLILKLPGGNARKMKVVETQVCTTDILPTVLEFTGITAPAKLDGKSLQPYFT